MAEFGRAVDVLERELAELVLETSMTDADFSAAPKLGTLAAEAGLSPRELVNQAIEAIKVKPGLTKIGRTVPIAAAGRALAQAFNTNVGVLSRRLERVAGALNEEPRPGRPPEGDRRTGKRNIPQLCRLLAEQLVIVVAERPHNGSPVDDDLAVTVDSELGIAIPCTDDIWLAIAGLILTATRVTIVGHVPLRLINGLQAILEDGHEPNKILSIRYITEPQSEIHRGQQSLYGHRLQQEWTAGLTGLRNVVRQLPRAAKKAWEMYEFARTSEEVGTSCVIRCEGHAERRTFLLTPIATVTGANVQHAVSEFADHDDVISDWIDRIEHEAGMLVMREAVCPAPSDPSQKYQSGFVETRITSLQAAGQPVNECAKPIVLVILRRRARGGHTHIVLKHRTTLTHNEDFDVWSLISARILESDLAAALGLEPFLDSSPGTALKKLAEAGHQPESSQNGSYLLSKEACIAAAVREVFWTTRLDVHDKDFEFLGTHFLRREDNASVWLQFFVFSADVDLDEVERAVAFDEEGVCEVSVSELWTSGLPLNRFLLHRRQWLERQLAK